MDKPGSKTGLIHLVPRVGLEPTTLGLEVLCSIQLSYQGVVRDTGVEPVSSVWKTDILADIRIPLATTGAIITSF